MMSNARRKVAVLGSINMDLVIRCAHFPAPGETVIGQSFAEVPGGKGANQAVAAARLGADVRMIGSVGDDAFGHRLLDQLRQENVDVSDVMRRSNCPSGVAVVTVEKNGENAIVVVPGANGMLDVSDVSTVGDAIRTADTLLLQLEIPQPTVLAAMSVARDFRKRVILDPAPVPSRFALELLDVDLICPNQSEAGAILGSNIDSVEAACDAASELTRRGARNAVITLGEQGAVASDGGSARWIKSFPVSPTDTTAAGDALAGALAVFWTDAAGLYDAVRLACAAGAIAATRHGAQPSLPTLAEVMQLANSSLS